MAVGDDPGQGDAVSVLNARTPNAFLVRLIRWGTKPVLSNVRNEAYAGPVYPGEG